MKTDSTEYNDEQASAVNRLYQNVGYNEGYADVVKFLQEKYGWSDVYKVIIDLRMHFSKEVIPFRNKEVSDLMNSTGAMDVTINRVLANCKKEKLDAAIRKHDIDVFVNNPLPFIDEINNKDYNFSDI